MFMDTLKLGVKDTGMGKKDLPLAKGKKIAKVFEKRLGWACRRNADNHFVLTHPDHPNLYISIPDHKEVDRNLLRTELKKAGITTKDFRKKYDGF